MVPPLWLLASAEGAGSSDVDPQSSLQPVVLGWPDFEPVSNSGDDREDIELEPPQRPTHVSSTNHPQQAEQASAPARVSNLGSLARNVMRQSSAADDFESPLRMISGAEPWIVPSANEDPQPVVQPNVSQTFPAPTEAVVTEPVIETQPYVAADPPYVACNPEEIWTQQLLPDGLMFKSFLAGEKEPRFASVWLNDPDRGRIWETALGARIGIWRYGTQGAVNPNGWQLDLEGGALTRLDPEENTDVDAADFVIGILMTRRIGPNAIEFGYGHLSSHVGDEYMIKHPTFQRINYVRDSVLFGLSHDVTPDLRIYGEIAYAPGAEGGAEPLEAQFGSEYSPAKPYLSPFAAVNFHYREEFGFQFSVNVEAGFQLRGPTSNKLFRFGVQHYNGKSLQYEFFDEYETLTGAGLWVDF